MGCSLHPEESYRLWCVFVCDIETSKMKRAKAALSRAPQDKERERERTQDTNSMEHSLS
jgi:hypothetical protein